MAPVVGAAVNGEWNLESVLPELDFKPESNTGSPLDFFHILERLKTTKRAGWQRPGFDIMHGESIADHMYRMSILTMLAPPSLASKLNIPHCTKMALVHDMAESLVGDITPVDNVPKIEKARRESVTMDYLCNSLLAGIPAGQDIRAIWDEYEASETLESHFVHDLDKIELILQTIEYERKHKCQKDLSEFMWVATRIQLPDMKKWCASLVEERRKLWENAGKASSNPVKGDGTAMETKLEEQLGEYYGPKKD